MTRKMFSFFLVICMLLSTLPFAAFAAEKSLSEEYGAVQITGQKIWEDDNNAGNTRPESITVHLLADGKKVAEKKVTGPDWTYSFDISEGVPGTNANPADVTFTVTEDAVPGYNLTATQNPVVEFNPPTADDWEKIPPCNELSIQNTADTKTVVIAKKGNAWLVWSFDPLAKFERELIVASAESEVSGNMRENNTTFVSGLGTSSEFGMTVSAEKITFASKDDWSHVYVGTYNRGSASATESSLTNTLKKQSITVSKLWEDAGNQDSIRPDSITVKLLADDVDTGKQVTLNEANGWTASFTGLNVYAGQKAIVYTVKETPVEGYTDSYSWNADRTAVIVTNTHETYKTSITVTKKWEDGNNQDDIRPDSVTVKLLADGEDTGKTVTLNKDNDWTASFSGLDVNTGRKTIAYTVEETEVEGYSASYSWNADHTAVTVTNTHDTGKTSVTITKTWKDENDQDKLRPESITVTLYKGEGDSKAKVGDYTISAKDSWKKTVENLPAYENGKKIVYSVDEAKVPEGYTKSVDGFSITNTHVPAAQTVTVSGSKTWIDNEDAAKARPKSITINLLADGEQKDSVTVTAKDGWKWSFQNLPKNKNGKEIVYTITEKAVADYDTKVDGYNVTNTYNPGKTYVTVNKEWVDNKNQDGKRPDSVTIQLYANGEKLGDPVELNAKNQWTHTFTNIDKTSGGKQIEYTVKEKAVDGYKTTYSVKDNVITVTNTHEPETKDLTVSKLWYDNKDKGKLRPDSIEAQLYKNGKAYGDTVKLTAKGNWKYTFEDMNVYEGGKKIEWTVKEVKVPKYYNVSYKQDALTIINTIQSDGSAKTGDDFNIWLWVGLMGVSAACAATFLILNKKRKSA